MATNTFEGGGGADTLDGGFGNDTLSYAGSSAGVTINLGTGEASGGDADGDSFLNFENILGSAFADNLTGDANNNTIDGGAGNDTIRGGGGTEELLGGAGDDIIFSSGVGSQFSTLDGGDGNDTLFLGGDMLNGDSGIGGAGFDVIAFETVYSASYSINGGDDIDLVSASNQTADFEIDLAAGRMNFVGSTDSLTESTITNIENIHGSAGNDILTGDANDNRIEGDLGDDLINGGAGNDTAVYFNVSSAVTVNLNTVGIAQDTGGGGEDTLISIENLSGSSFNDTLIGSVQDNVLDGLLGDDTLQGGQGNDILNGNEGNDTVDFTLATSGVTVDLNIQGAAQNTWGTDQDTLISIENITGSGLDDIIIGDAGNNELSGAGGDDIIDGGLGADTLDGGADTDTASYASSSETVFVNLLNGTAFGGDAEGDTLISIENLIGSAFNDRLVGDSNNNQIDGGDGDDVLGGGDGDDILNGGAGFDFLEGGDGADSLNGGDGNDDLYGGAGVDILTGGAGSDDFVVNVYSDSGVGANADVITDFELGDTVTISEYSFVTRDPNIGELLTFIGEAAFTGNNSPELRFEKTGGQTLVQVDTDGDGKVDSEVIIQSGEFDLRLTGDEGATLEVDAAFGSTTAGDDILVGTNGNDTLVGGDGNDNLRDLAGDDIIDSGAGDDFISVGAGNDSVDGGDGFDQISYFGAAQVNLTITDTSVFDAVSGETDTLTGIEIISHSQRLAVPSDDILDASAATVSVRLFGGRGDDIIIGGSNDDTIEGDTGTDTLTGGAGNDRFTFDFVEEIDNDIITDLEVGDTVEFTFIEFIEGVDLTYIDTDDFTGLAGEFRYEASGGQTVFQFDIDGDKIADRFITITNGEFTLFETQPGLLRFGILNEVATSGNDTIVGTNGDDILDGLEGNDNIRGLAGDDIIIGGAGGDTIDGGEGNDTLSYATSDSFVTADLELDFFNGGHAAGDLVTNIENLVGSDFSDELFGDANDNIIEGGAGADRLDGRDGNDTFVAGLGNDTIDGGNGQDILSFANATASISIFSLDDGTLIDATASGLGEENITSIEGIIGTDFDDFILLSVDTADTRSLFFDGGAGNDFIRAGNGNDEIHGGDGDDNLRGNGGDDMIFGGAGDDFIRSDAGVDTIDGGEGDNDRISFFNLDATQGVIADLRTGITTNDGFGNMETFTNIEGLGAGTAFVDLIDGDDNDNLLLGAGFGDTINAYAGDDTVQVDSGGTYDGGAGTDTFAIIPSNRLIVDMDGDGFADFEDQTTGVTVDLQSGVISEDGYGGTGTAVNFENLTGGTFR